MALISVTQSLSKSSIVSEIIEASNVGVNATSPVDVSNYTKHSFQVSSVDFNTYQRLATPPTPQATPVPLNSILIQR